MPQNRYDDGDFFAAYERLPRSVRGLDGAPEWPSLESLLPDVHGSAVLDLGCGFGWFCRWARAAGARQVLGVDVSARMLERARAGTDDDAIEYRRGDLETVELPAASFDLAYSSLTLHYLADLCRLFGEVHRAIVPGGRFVFSVEHPIFTAPSRPGFAEIDGLTVWPVSDYLIEGPRTTDWLAPGVIKQHRTVGTYASAVLNAGFTIAGLEEWGPSEAQVTEHPEWADELHRPPFLLIACDR